MDIYVNLCNEMCIFKGNPDICNNMDEPGGYCAKWCEAERNTPHNLSYMWNLKQQQQQQKTTQTKALNSVTE